MTAPRFSPHIELQSFYVPPIKHPNLLGYAGVRMLDVGIVIRGISITQKEKEVWANLPRRHDDFGKRHPLIIFDYAGDFFDFCARVIELVRAAHPEAFTDPPAAPIPAAAYHEKETHQCRT